MSDATDGKKIVLLTYCSFCRRYSDGGEATKVLSTGTRPAVAPMNDKVIAVCLGLLLLLLVLAPRRGNIFRHKTILGGATSPEVQSVQRSSIFQPRFRRLDSDRGGLELHQKTSGFTGIRTNFLTTN